MPIDDPHSSIVREAPGDEPPWGVVAERIDAFAAAWDDAAARGDDPPKLDRFTAGLDDRTARQVLIELAKLDIERRWQENRYPQHIEWYAAEFPLLTPIGKLPVDLIYEELQARMAAGLSIYQEEVIQRFPVQASASEVRLPGIELTMLVGRYAQAHFLHGPERASVTVNTRDWRAHAPRVIPLPHPSPRNIAWFKANPWFEDELLPVLRRRVRALVER